MTPNLAYGGPHVVVTIHQVGLSRTLGTHLGSSSWCVDEHRNEVWTCSRL